MKNPIVGERARYFGSNGGTMDGTIKDVWKVGKRTKIKMKFDQYDGHVEGYAEIFRRIKHNGEPPRVLKGLWMRDDRHGCMSFVPQTSWHTRAELDSLQTLAGRTAQMVLVPPPCSTTPKVTSDE